MSVLAFSGGAGCGKTHQLMAALAAHLHAQPLLDGQKVLALTFMHGSRRRLDERLSTAASVGKRYQCSTIDSFAWQIARRWRSLLGFLEMGVPAAGNYAGTCQAAAALLGQIGVAEWVARSYPVILVDEAQDLDPVRLAIISALARHVHLFAAADEFQCLDEALRPNPACEWLAQADNIAELTVPRRTEVPSLLGAAAALRGGEAPLSNGAFLIKPGFQVPLAGTFLANELGWYGARKTVAVITPSAGRFATDVVSWVSARTTKQRNGPFAIHWERSDDRTLTDYLVSLEMAPEMAAAEVADMVGRAGDDRVFSDVSEYLDKQRRAKGRTWFSSQEIDAVIRQSFANRRRFGSDNGRGFRAMTVHGAKNREFDNVVVLWPAAIGGDAEHKRRLLYNAVTRAKARCLVLVQSREAFERPPFVARV